jgi:hypothetical protein
VIVDPREDRITLYEPIVNWRVSNETNYYMRLNPLFDVTTMKLRKLSDR